MSGDPVRVVGAVIVRDGLVLCARRGAKSRLAGLWEFPGGKVEPGETPKGALEREIREELSLGVTVGHEITTTVHAYDAVTVALTTYFCEVVEGEPLPTEHDQIGWLLPARLGTLEWAAADLPAVSLVQRLLRTSATPGAAGRPLATD